MEMDNKEFAEVIQSFHDSLENEIRPLLLTLKHGLEELGKTLQSEKIAKIIEELDEITHSSK